jgi:hypothetical protein
MYVEPSVVRAKVDRELAAYVELADYYRQRGIWLLEYKFPELLFAMVARNNKPQVTVAFGVLFDFSNYDVEPPSVRFVDPLTKKALRFDQLPFVGRAYAPPRPSEPFVAAWDASDECPFLCQPGVREYHDNPGHSGDSWFLHRGSGVGRLGHLLDMLARRGSEAINGTQFQIQVAFGGFNYSLADER